MATIDLPKFIEGAVGGGVGTLTFDGIEPSDSPNLCRFLLRLDPKQLRGLPAELRAQLEPQCKDPLRVTVVWDDSDRAVTLTMATAAFTINPNQQPEVFAVLNTLNNNVGTARFFATDRGVLWEMGAASTQYLPLPGHPAIASELFSRMVTQFVMEASQATSVMSAVFQKLASEPAEH